MKTLRARSVLFGAAILLLGASARQASAGEIHGWGSAGFGGHGGYEYSDGGSCGYGACGFGGYGLSAAGGCCNWPPTDYARYVVGHGPIYPGAGYTPAYSYMTPPAPNTPPATNTPPAPIRRLVPTVRNRRMARSKSGKSEKSCARPFAKRSRTSGDRQELTSSRPSVEFEKTSFFDQNRKRLSSRTARPSIRATRARPFGERSYHSSSGSSRNTLRTPSLQSALSAVK